MFGKEPIVLLDAKITVHRNNEYLAEERQNLESSAAEQLRLTQQRNKRRYGSRFNAQKWCPFKVGDRVKIRDHGRMQMGSGATKFARRWQGPFVILDRKDTTFKVNQGSNGRWVNADQLAPWHDRTFSSQGRASVVSNQVVRLMKVDFGDPNTTRTGESANNVAGKLADIKSHRMSHDSIGSTAENTSNDELLARQICRNSAQTDREWTIEL